MRNSVTQTNTSQVLLSETLQPSLHLYPVSYDSAYRLPKSVRMIMMLEMAQFVNDNIVDDLVWIHDDMP
jgi:hypothetical protein